MAQHITGYADSRTTKLYDRRGQKVLPGVWNAFGIEGYSVIPLAEHDTALLRQIEVGFHFLLRCSVIVAAPLGTH